jgi:stage II sporulation protein AA (anti-sigma F factor antagonist)
MQITFNKYGSTLIVKMIGELDHHSAENVRYKIDNNISSAGVSNLLFDFSEISFMDSSGIGVIIGRYKNITEHGGNVGIVNMNKSIKKVFELAGILNLIKEYKTIEEFK